MKVLCATEDIKYVESRAGEQTSGPVRMNWALHEGDGIWIRICVLIPL